MMFGNVFGMKPATPQALAVREFIKRNQSRFDNLQALTDAELADLEHETDGLITDEERWQMYSVDNEVKSAWFSAMEYIKAERRRRDYARSSAFLRRHNSATAVTACLTRLATHATGAESLETAKALGLTADDILGMEPPTVAKVSRAEVAGMTDEDLHAALSAAVDQAHYSAPFVSEADKILAALDYLAPLARELKRRQSLLSKCRERGEENQRVLELEQSERNRRKADEAAKNAELAKNTPALLAQIIQRLDAIESA